MVFEAISTMLGGVNFFGFGILFIIIGITFAIARGVTKDSGELILWFITLSTFSIIAFFPTERKWILTISVVSVFIYAMTKFKFAGAKYEQENS